MLERPLKLIINGQMPTVLAVGAVGDYLKFFPHHLSLWEMARYRSESPSF